MESCSNCQEKAVEVMKKGPWTRDEDQKLLAYIEHHGHGSWRALPAKAGLQRCGKSCRLRWKNYLRPDIKRGKFTTQEEKSIIRLHALLGNRWSAIAAHLPERTDNEIKNYWNTRLKKRLIRMGIDPETHKPKNDPDGGPAQSRQAATLDHMAQWETARLEAEARLVRESKRLANLHLQLLLKATAPSPPPCLDVLKVWQATVMANGPFGALESPTSTLNFACSVAPAAGLINSSTIPTNNGMFGGGHAGILTGIRSPVQVQETDITHAMSSYHNATCSGDDFSINYDNMVSALVGEEISDKRISYWNELLNLVGSPMDSPVFLD